jgi:hypothetical protein
MRAYVEAAAAALFIAAMALAGWIAGGIVYLG